jgi:ParB-like nuclease domain
MQYQLFDALPAHIEDALRASIERFGVIVPVVRDQHGQIIDGHHRARIADELGVKYRADTVTVADEDEAREVARHLNTRRRHLSGEQLREHIVMLAQRATASGVGELSQREIAQVAGVAPSYVNKVLSDPQVFTSEHLPEARRGADGKVYPAHRSTLEAVPDLESEDVLFGDAQGATSDLAPGIVRCASGHDASREAVEDAGGCPYCIHTEGERQAAIQAREALLRRQKQEREAEKRQQFDEAVADYPELAYYAQQPDKAVAIAANLKQFTEPELSMRRETLAKAIAADERRSAEPDEPEGPNYFELADAMFVALNSAAKVVARSGGAEALRQAVPGAPPLMIQMWREQFADLAETCTALAAECSPRLRRVK